MKIKKMLIISVLIVLFQGSTALMAGKDFIKKHWQSVFKYYMEAAEMMPEEHFGFKPTKEIFSYAEQLLHIARGNFFGLSMAKGVKPPKDKAAFIAEGKSKKEVLALLKESFEYGLQILESLDEEKLQSTLEYGGKKWTLASVFLFGCEHSIHHRGQMIIYLRLKGIKPPKYSSGYLD